MFKKKEKTYEPQYYSSATNMPTYNYHVYNMPLLEKILTFAVAFAAGAAVGFLFYGGIGKDEFGEPTNVTRVLNILIPSIVGVIAGLLFIPSRTKSIVQKRQKELGHTHSMFPSAPEKTLPIRFLLSMKI